MSVRGAPAAFPCGPDSALLNRVTGRGARRPVWRLSRCIATSRLHPRVVDFTLTASCLSGQCCGSCAPTAVRRFSRADRPLRCRSSAMQFRVNLGAASPVPAASRQLRTPASASQSRSFLGHGRCARRELPHGHRAIVYSPTAAEASTIPSGYRCQCVASLLARRPLLRQTAGDLVHVAGVPWRTWLW